MLGKPYAYSMYGVPMFGATTEAMQGMYWLVSVPPLAQDLGSRVQGFRLRVSGLGFQV